MLELFTARGSHVIGALCCIKVPASRCNYPELTDASGKVSMSRKVELQKSVRVPPETGSWYKVVPGDLEVARLGLMLVLSPIGNASNAVYRLPTSLQFCARVHAVDKTFAGQQDC